MILQVCPNLALAFLSRSSATAPSYTVIWNHQTAYCPLDSQALYPAAPSAGGALASPLHLENSYSFVKA